MKREDLFRAVGEMDEAFLAQSELAATERPKRVLWKTALVAAVIGSLAITAMAAAVTEIVGKAQKREQTLSMQDFSGEVVCSYTVDAVDVYIDWAMELDDLEGIEEYYVPSAMEIEDLNSFDISSEDGVAIDYYSLGWQPDGFEEYEFIQFTQFSGCGYSAETPVDTIMGVPADVDVTTKTILRDDRAYLCFSCQQWEERMTCTNRLYWTDGCCIYRLIYPNWMDEEQIVEIADSLSPVDTIWRYSEIASSNWKTNMDQEWVAFTEKWSSDAPYALAAQAGTGWTQISEAGILEVYADFPLGENGAETLERIVYPRYFDGYELTYSWAKKQEELASYHVSWTMPEYEEEVWFGQLGCGDYHSCGVVGAISDRVDPDELQMGLTEIGTYQFLEASFGECNGIACGGRYLYWTDGTYIFYLRVPYEMGAAEIQAIVESIR